ncbi:MAG: hypothetical protein LBK23_10465 [Oscillospiraceae bacterium]|jgi:hypothetical protein|nr:hypothetical protein [Oscillospiraceae bacterium]
MKIFHSMPLRGKTPAEIEFSRSWQHEAAKKAVATTFGVPVEECEILDTFIKENVPENANALWYFGEGVRTYLSQTDVLALAPDWAGARGCVAEKFVAESYDIPVIVLEYRGENG